ncbi:MAG: ATP-dependent helicase [bacterium]|nr:ATP-dependent helicase [bacterium]
MKKYTIKKKTGTPKKKFAINYKDELNANQYKAVTTTTGPHLVIAGAGSGKTRTLIFRVAYLVENNIPPASILLLTFTRKASQEMMYRASTILDDRCRRVSGGTFHSFATRLLRKHALQIGYVPNFNIVDRGDSEDILQVIRTQLALNKKDRRFPKKRTLMDVISTAVNKCTNIKTILRENYPHFAGDYDDIQKVADLYKKFKREKMVMDYDDLLVNLRDLLRDHDEVREKLSDTYKYIMVDEYQDTNRLQADIAVLLAEKHKNIMVVGDDSQSIYSFRGANFRNIMDFPDYFPGTEIITLEQNYRSTQPILKLTNAVIEESKEKYSKELFSNIEGEQKPVYIDASDEEEQSLFISQRILELREEGVPLNEIAVLFRSAWHSNELEIELQNKNIPYVKYGGLKFADAAHVKDTLAFMRVLHNVFDEIAWLRLLLLFPGIGPATAQKVIGLVIGSGGNFKELKSEHFANKKYYDTLCKLSDLLTHLSTKPLKPAEQLDYVILYYTPIFEKRYDDFKRRARDLESLVRICQRYDKLEHMLTDMALEPPQRSQVDNDDSDDTDDEQLVLSTIHSSKGLEWHSVFVIHLVDGFFPSSMSMEKEEQLEEERRLFYVATTRARENLYLITPDIQARSWQTFDGGFTITQPSQFITELHDFDDLTEIWDIDFDDDPF